MLWYGIALERGLGVLRNFLAEENGQGMVETGLIISLIALAAVVGLTLLRSALADRYDNIKDAIINAGANS